MDIRFVVKNVDVPNDLKEYMEQKLSKMEKFFSRILDNQIVVNSLRNNFIVEVTSNVNGVILRGEQKDADLRKAFDLALKNLERRIIRHKGYLLDRAHLKTHDISFGNLGGDEVVEESKENIVKVKHFDLTSMDPEEATMQMDLLGHSFFVFTDGETGKINVVYKRDSGGYGLLVPNG